MRIRPYHLLILLALAVGAALALRAQDGAQSILRPPAGSKIALVVFEDLECPDCRRAEPLLEEAKKTYNLPVVVYDFPLPQHSWAMDASVYAHFFRSKSTKKENLEAEFRKYIYENQEQITSPAGLRSFAEKFAAEHHVVLPFVIDPQGKFAAEIRADQDKAKMVGIQHTPTIYVVTDQHQGKPFVEVVNRDQLFQLIDEMKQEAGLGD